MGVLRDISTRRACALTFLNGVMSDSKIRKPQVEYFKNQRKYSWITWTARA